MRRTFWKCFLLVGFLLAMPRCLFADTAGREVVLSASCSDLVVGPGMIATHRCLKDCEFQAIELAGSQWDGSDLYGMRLYQCDLSESSFRGADLRGLLISDCRVVGADFSDAWINGLRPSPPIGSKLPDIRFTEEQLKSTKSYKEKKLQHCIIAGTYVTLDTGDKEIVASSYDFSNANLMGAYLLSADLTECNFTEAIIRNSNFESCIIAFEQLRKTQSYSQQDFSGCRFVSVVFTDVPSFAGLDLSFGHIHPIHPEADFGDAIITNCYLSEMSTDQLAETRSFKRRELMGITFVGSDFSRADFSGTNLTGAKFIRCNLKDADLSNAVITNVDFSRATDLSRRQLSASWNAKYDNMQSVKMPEQLIER